MKPGYLIQKLSNACARDIEVLVSGKCVWTGSLPETFGDDDDNICVWINVRASVKKTARTTRQNGSSPATERFAGSAADAKAASTLHSQSACADLQSTGTPLWLSGASSSTALTSRSVAGEGKPNLFAAEEKAPSGSVTARRRAQQDADTESGSKNERRDAPAGLKESDHDRNLKNLDRNAHSSSRSESTEAKPHKPADGVRQTHSRSSDVSMWDSLEHFSKTSRLPLSTDSGETSSRTSDAAMKADAKEAPERRLAASKTSSALLDDLRSKSTNLYGLPVSSVSKVLKESSWPGGATPRDVPDELKSLATIPVLPSGTRLKLEILSTWGDPHYVGLNGIELFDHSGKSVSFRQPEQQVRACPASINDLDKYSDDPRVASNLVDGVNFTCDDFHMWLAPFALGDEHYVELELDSKTSLSMIRVWNYNKSRAHSYRGVRHARLVMYASSITKAMERPQSSGTVIFEGEICKALGVASADCLDQSCEVILFTKDEAILHAIEANDRTLTEVSQSSEDDKESCAIVVNVRSSMEMQRPRTSDKGGSGNLTPQEPYADFIRRESNANPPLVGRDGRPTTAAVRPLAASKAITDPWLTRGGEPQQRLNVLENVTECRDESGDDEAADQDDDTLVRGRRITIKLLSTWGDANYIGLTQLDVLVGRHGRPFPVDASHVDATPRDLESVRVLQMLMCGMYWVCYIGVADAFDFAAYS